MVHWGSKYGIEEFLEVKYLCMGGIERQVRQRRRVATTCLYSSS
jgi:hypothetical protein